MQYIYIVSGEPKGGDGREELIAWFPTHEQARLFIDTDPGMNRKNFYYYINEVERGTCFKE